VYRLEDGKGDAVIEASFRADKPLPTQGYALQVYTYTANDVVNIQVTGGCGGLTCVFAYAPSGLSEPIAVDLTGVERIILRFRLADNTNELAPSFSTDGGSTFTTINLPVPATTFTSGSSEAIVSVVGSVALTLPPPPAARADLAVSKADAPDPVVSGNNLTYTITVTNEGPDTATDVVLMDVLPGGVSLVPGGLGSTQGSCSGDATVTCSLGDLASGSSADVGVVVKPTSTGVLSNTASVSATSPDPNLANNSATVATTVALVLRETTVTALDAFEPSVAVDPKDEKHAVVGFIALAGGGTFVLGARCYWAESRDGGKSWKVGLLPAPQGFRPTFDPWVRFARDGQLFYSCIGNKGLVTQTMAVLVAVSGTGLAQDFEKANVVGAPCQKQANKFCVDRPSLAVLQTPTSPSGFRVIACWTENLPTGESKIAVSYSDDGRTWAAPVHLGGPLATACSAGGGDSSVAVSWFNVMANALELRTSSDGIAWSPSPPEPPRMIDEAGALVDMSSTTPRVWSVPYVLVVGEDLRVVYQRRLEDHSQVFVKGSPSSPRQEIGRPNSETLLPGTGTCPHLVGAYEARSAAEDLRYTVWSDLTADATGKPGLLFESSRVVRGSDGKPTPDTPPRIGDYTSVDCSGDLTWAAWTGPGKGDGHPTIWLAVIEA